MAAGPAGHHRVMGAGPGPAPVYPRETTVGLFSAITKGALAKKAVDEARKPQNQAKIKSAIASMRNKGGTGTTGRR